MENAMLDRALELYVDLHQHPELAGAEERTADRFAARLRECGLKVTTGIGGHGVLGMLSSGDGPTVLLRAELDALPIAEETGLPYAADEAAGVMHACGHDAHLACLAGAATLLARHRDAWRGTLVVVGQPAEEELSGAAAMLADGLYERCGRPDVVLAQHLTPLPTGWVAHCPDAVTAASRTLELRVHGRGGHAGLRQFAVDPVPVAAAIVLDAAGIADRLPAAVTVGTIRGGSRPNVIPDMVTLGISVRAPTAAVLGAAVRDLAQIANEHSRRAGCPRPPELTTTSAAPAGQNDPAAGRVVRKAHLQRFGQSRMLALPPSMATDDFPLLTLPDSDRPIPSVYWMIGATPARRWAEADGTTLVAKAANVPANHSARFAPDPARTLRTGIAAMTGAALAFLTGPTSEGKSTS
ncbi:amidohydrolase [Catenulispora rubra]|uniref:amidohydrolase n=1 Tax=Catenulispora rubra TaxID=280293 RepID=UPI001E42956E|nr:amidohydrolase [Catenulispora rubra]